MNILFADDHHLILDGLNGLISTNFPQANIFTAFNKVELFSKLKQENIDLLIQDIKFGKHHAKDFIEILKTDFPKLKIIMLSTVSDTSTIQYFLKRANGYILKTEPITEIIDGINAVLNKKSFISKQTSKKLSQQFTSNDIVLSRRELEITRLIMQEKSTKKIANTLNISIKTVEMHRSNIYLKLDVKNIMGFIKKIVALGLVED